MYSAIIIVELLLNWRMEASNELILKVAFARYSVLAMAVRALRLSRLTHQLISPPGTDEYPCWLAPPFEAYTAAVYTTQGMYWTRLMCARVDLHTNGDDDDNDACHNCVYPVLGLDQSTHSFTWC